jgi:hypothetical protein
LASSAHTPRRRLTSAGGRGAQAADPRRVEEPREDATLAELAAQLADCTDDLVLLYSYAAPQAL